MSTFLNTIKQVIAPESSIKMPIINVDENNENVNDENLYDKLDDKYKALVDKITNEKHKNQAIQIFASDNNKNKQELYDNINNPELLSIYNKLNNKSKTYIDSISIVDKYLFLKEKQRKAKVIEPTIKKNTKLSVIHPDNITNVKNTEIMDEEKPEREEEQEQKLQIKGLSSKETPQELFAEEEEKEDDYVNTKDSAKENTKDNVKDSKNTQEQFNQLINLYYSSNPFGYNNTINQELEVRFGTRGIKPLTITDYDNVIRKLKSLGFNAVDVNGNYSLRINCEYLDNVTGRIKLSDIRTEINGLHNIQNYCKNNNLKEIYVNATSCVNFVRKKMVTNAAGNKIFPVNMDDFNFRVSYSNEETVKKGLQHYIIENWKKSKKVFRYMNRVTFKHDDYPFNVDISITKYATKRADKWGNLGRGDMIRVYNVDESNVFNNPPEYEIEIEVDNKLIGPGTKFNSPKILLASLKKVIKFVLCGLQGTNYPVSYPEQKTVIQSYMKMIWEDEYNSKEYIKNKHFIGPSSKTLQLENISPINPECLEPNIRNSFVVTEKADGQRTLLYVTDTGKIYLIDMNMKVMFTGAKTNNKDNFNCLLDGELIKTNKKGDYINLYAAFDIYYYNNKDVRHLTFMLLDKDKEKEKDIYNARYQLLKLVTKSLNPESIIENNTEKQGIVLPSPIKITSKEFYPYSTKQTIFDGCNEILTKVNENRYEYETDGLIFTHAYFGVGSDKIGQSGKKYKITWDFSFKWKPPKQNTIDFLVTTVKGINGDDLIKPIFEEGMNTDLSAQYNEYKTIELRCGFSERDDIYINPCQDIIDDKLPEKRSTDRKYNDIYPMRFYPTMPFDVDAGITKIMLNLDETGKKQMYTEEFEAFTDNTIVEFSYDFDRETGWRWVPLRVRHDKTTEYLQGNKQYGNSYTTCNNNWKSIHYPITEIMIRTGENIPSALIDKDIYYNTPSGTFLTEAMKNFHNLYVKKMLIKNVSKPGDNLIDYACGKAGDLSKWIEAKLSFVFGIDISSDNLENRLNGACVRYLNSTKENKYIPYALFVNGNSAYNIKNGSAMLNDKAVQITKAIFGIGSKDPNTIGKGVARQHGVGDNGFNISSCQFAIHYFFKNPNTLQGFLRNVAECTKLNGYFIGTAYDGKEVFNILKKVKTGEGIKIIENNKKIWEIIKGYGSDVFDDDSSSIGYEINVFQESINQYITEYLINFNYLFRVFENYGFKIIDQEEAKHLNLPSGTGMFNQLYDNMMQEISRNKFKEADYGKAKQMTSAEKKISFLNRYFVFKKMREVNTEKIQLEMSEYNNFDVDNNNKDTIAAVAVAKKENVKIKPRVKKLSNKLMLVPSTEEAIKEPKSEIEEPKLQEEIKVSQEEIKLPEETKPKSKRKQKTNVKLTIKEDDL
jgi:hypothetical protein